MMVFRFYFASCFAVLLVVFLWQNTLDYCSAAEDRVDTVGKHGEDASSVSSVLIAVSSLLVVVFAAAGITCGCCPSRRSASSDKHSLLQNEASPSYASTDSLATPIPTSRGGVSPLSDDGAGSLMTCASLRSLSTNDGSLPMAGGHPSDSVRNLLELSEDGGSPSISSLPLSASQTLRPPTSSTPSDDRSKQAQEPPAKRPMPDAQDLNSSEAFGSAISSTAHIVSAPQWTPQPPSVPALSPSNPVVAAVSCASAAELLPGSTDNFASQTSLDNCAQQMKEDVIEQQKSRSASPPAEDLSPQPGIVERVEIDDASCSVGETVSSTPDVDPAVPTDDKISSVAMVEASETSEESAAVCSSDCTVHVAAEHIEDAQRCKDQEVDVEKEEEMEVEVMTAEEAVVPEASAPVLNIVTPTEETDEAAPTEVEVSVVREETASKNQAEPEIAAVSSSTDELPVCEIAAPQPVLTASENEPVPMASQEVEGSTVERVSEAQPSASVAEETQEAVVGMETSSADVLAEPESVCQEAEACSHRPEESTANTQDVSMAMETDTTAVPQEPETTAAPQEPEQVSKEPEGTSSPVAGADLSGGSGLKRQKSQRIKALQEKMASPTPAEKQESKPKAVGKLSPALKGMAIPIPGMASPIPKSTTTAADNDERESPSVKDRAKSLKGVPMMGFGMPPGGIAALKKAKQEEQAPEEGDHDDSVDGSALFSSPGKSPSMAAKIKSMQGVPIMGMGSPGMLGRSQSVRTPRKTAPEQEDDPAESSTISRSASLVHVTLNRSTGAKTRRRPSRRHRKEQLKSTSLDQVNVADEENDAEVVA